eukprot:3916097-Pleurochrysis_carterae.AAC.2
MLVRSSILGSEIKSCQDCLKMGRVHSEVPSRMCSGLVCHHNCSAKCCCPTPAAQSGCSDKASSHRRRSCSCSSCRGIVCCILASTACPVRAASCMVAVLPAMSTAEATRSSKNRAVESVMGGAASGEAGESTGAEAASDAGATGADGDGGAEAGVACQRSSSPAAAAAVHAVAVRLQVPVVESLLGVYGGQRALQMRDERRREWLAELARHELRRAVEKAQLKAAAERRGRGTGAGHPASRPLRRLEARGSRRGGCTCGSNRLHHCSSGAADEDSAQGGRAAVGPRRRPAAAAAGR